MTNPRGITLHTCWDNHEGPDGGHLDGSPCRDTPVRYVPEGVLSEFRLYGLTLDEIKHAIDYHDQNHPHLFPARSVRERLDKVAGPAWTGKDMGCFCDPSNDGPCEHD